MKTMQVSASSWLVKPHYFVVKSVSACTAVGCKIIIKNSELMNRTTSVNL